MIFETSRLATIVNGVLRKTTHDLELNGKSNNGFDCQNFIIISFVGVFLDLILHPIIYKHKPTNPAKQSSPVTLHGFFQFFDRGENQSLQS